MSGPTWETLGEEKLNGATVVGEPARKPEFAQHASEP